jgi:hypothetical protein
MTDFIKAIGNKPTEKAIIAYFKDGSKADYTMAIYGLLITDRGIRDIVDGETGEIIYSAK